MSRLLRQPMIVVGGSILIAVISAVVIIVAWILIRWINLQTALGA